MFAIAQPFCVRLCHKRDDTICLGTSRKLCIDVTVYEACQMLNASNRSTNMHAAFISLSLFRGTLTKTFSYFAAPEGTPFQSVEDPG